MKIKSSMDWEVSSTIGTSSNLRFSPNSGTGDANTESIVEITVTSQADSGWDGGFYIEYENGDRTEFIEYENGDRTEFIVHQQGAFKKLGEYTQDGTKDTSAESDLIYYYGVFKMNKKLWLDRNIGASVGQDGINGYFTNVPDSDIPSDPAARGAYFTRRQADKACPPGFRLPKGVRNSGDGELDWVDNEIKWSNTGTVEVPYKYVQYVTYSDDPLKRWFIPVGSNSSSPLSTYGYYWSHKVGCFYFASNTSGNKFLYDGDAKDGMSVRCVQDS